MLNKRKAERIRAEIYERLHRNFLQELLLYHVKIFACTNFARKKRRIESRYLFLKNRRSRFQLQEKVVPLCSKSELRSSLFEASLPIFLFS